MKGSCSLSLIAALLLALLGSCARVVAPSGGPEDLEPPELVSVEPEPGAGLSELERIELVWSERLEKTSLSVSILPDLEQEARVRGRSVIVELDEKMPVGETIVLHVSGALSDTRGNSISAPVSLPFSTSDSLPSGALDLNLVLQGEGTVSADTRIELRDTGDSSLIRLSEPDSLGRALLSWLDDGEMLVRCFEDLDFDLEWNPELEAGAETTLVASGSDTLQLLLSLSVVDTIGPRIVEAEALDSYHVRVDFTEQLGSANVDSASFSLIDSSGVALDIAGLWLRSGRESVAAVLSTSGPMGEGTLMLRAFDVSDLVGNRTAADSIEMEGSSDAPEDSFRVTSHFPADGEVAVGAAGPFFISFSHWTDLEALSGRWFLRGVADSSVVDGTVSRIDGRSFSFVPDHELLGERQYVFELSPGLASVFEDTLTERRQWTFIPAWGDEPGMISGSVSGATGGYGLIIQVAPAGFSGGTVFRAIEPGLSSFLLDGIPAGRYTVSAFVDTDSDSVWAGSSEPYGAFPGVVEVFPGLESEGIDIEILP